MKWEMKEKIRLRQQSSLAEENRRAGTEGQRVENSKGDETVQKGQRGKIANCMNKGEKRNKNRTRQYPIRSINMIRCYQWLAPER